MMFRISYYLYLAFLALIFTSCGPKNANGLPAPSVLDKDAIRLAHYNVGGFFKSEFNSTSMVAAMMNELGVCAVSMNELDSCTTRHPEYQLKDFCDAMGKWNCTFAPAMAYRGGKYGIGIASSPDLKIVRQYRVTLPKGDGSEQRALAVCEFERFVFCSTHLDHKSAEAQHAQAETINSWMETHYGTSSKPVILCGDFNALPQSETIMQMKEEWAIISPDAFTFSAAKPSKRIDYIMVYKRSAGRVTVLDAKVPVSFKKGDVKEASDHLPVLVVIKIQ